jgi:hypothetical protein
MSESETGEEVVKPKRAPRKRVAKTASAKAAAKPRKTAAKKTPGRQAPRVAKESQSAAVPDDSLSPPRKAPTVFASEKNKHKQRQKQFIVIGIILLVGVGASAAVGYTDKGQINVTQVIEERNQRIRTGETDGRDAQTNRVEVPVQNTNKTANGGLVGLGTGGAKPTPKPPVDIATSTASSTDSTASSTDAVASSTSPTNESASSTEELTNPDEPDTEPDTQTATSS